MIRNARGPQDYDLEIKDNGDWIPFYLGRGGLETLSKIDDIGELTLRLDTINKELIPMVKKHDRTINDIRNAIHRARETELEQERNALVARYRR